MAYTPLHNHDEYSFLDGFAHPKEYLDKCIELGINNFAITNHGNQFSWVYYSKLLEESKYNNLNMIYGVEIYECFDMDIKDKNNKYFHLILLARTERGRRLINEIITTSNFKGFYSKPRVDLKYVKSLDVRDDIIACSACLGSKIARESDYKTCIEYIKEYKQVFNHFYLEMQSHKSIDQQTYNKKILQLSKDTDTQYVITTDSHAATNEDVYYQGRHVQIAQDKETMTESYEGCYLQSEEEIHLTMDSQIGTLAVNIGLNNTNIVANLIDDVKMPFQEPQLPSFPLPKGFSNDYDFLCHLIKDGWNNRNINRLSSDDIDKRKKRVEYELGVINQMKFDGYFIIVWDFINWAKENGIMVGAGRGSGAGSFVCYLLGITELDPVEFDLIFERFLNPERLSMPDLDIDLSDREPVVKYIVEKYGETKVCQVANFNFISPLNAIKDAFRVLNSSEDTKGLFPYTVANKLCKRFSFETFEECLEKNPYIYEEYPQYEEAFNIAAKISGRARGVGIHAGGVGIVDSNINDYMALTRGGKGESVIQVDKRVIEEIGIIKFDLLGVKTLKLVQDVITDLKLNPWDLDVNNKEFVTDKMSYELLCKANTNAIFQVESNGMKDLLSRLQPGNIEELSAVIALYRPDSMGALEEFIKCKHNPSEVHFIHDDMKSILNVTYGCMIYQEQLLDIVRTFGGRTYGGADKFRKGIGKKDQKLVQKESDTLYKEIMDTGYNEELARTISDDMRLKGGYCFNKSHSFSYAVLCLQTAYLKAHYPLHFYKALFNLRKDDNGRLNKYITDALTNNIQVLPPNINRSESDFIVYNDTILFGLSSIKDLGNSKVIPIIDERNINGNYTSLDNLISRVPISDKDLVMLVKSGAIPCKSKHSLLNKYIKEYLVVNKEYKPVKTLPTLSSLNSIYNINTDEIKDKNERLSLYNKIKMQEYNENQAIKNKKRELAFKEKYMEDEEMWEFEALSIFLTFNPFKEIGKDLPLYDEALDNTEVTIVGVIANTVVKKNQKKQQYTFITLCTAYGSVEISCWANMYSMYNELIKKGNRIAVKCQKTDDKFSVRDMKSYVQWRKDVGIAS